MLVEVYNKKIEIDVATGEGLGEVMKTIEPLILKLSRQFIRSINYLDIEDLSQDIRVLALEGIENYDFSKKTKLSTFLTTHLNNRLISVVKASNAEKRNASLLDMEVSGFNFSIPEAYINYWLESFNEDGKVLDDYISSKFVIHPQKDYADSFGFDISLGQVLRKKSLKYPLEVAAIQGVYFEDKDLIEVAKESRLSGWAISLRIKKFGEKFLTDLLEAESVSPNTVPSKNKVRKIFFRASP